MSDHQDQNILPAKVARGPVFVSAVILHSSVHDAVDVMDDDNLETSLSAQIQVA